MSRIGSSPMNLELMMSPNGPAQTPDGASATQYAIVFYHDKFDPPAGWTQTDSFTPDPKATYEVIVGDLGTWNVRSDKFAIYQKT